MLLIWPKLGDVSDVVGSANWGVLKKLIDSARKVSRKSCGRAKVRQRAALTLAILPLRKVLRPSVPARRCGAWTKAKAEKGSSEGAVSGSPRHGL